MIGRCHAPEVRKNAHTTLLLKLHVYTAGRIMDLERLVEQVPDILNAVVETGNRFEGPMKGLLATSRSLRAQVRAFATGITILEHSNTDLLTGKTWPAVQELDFRDPLTSIEMLHLSYSTWPRLMTMHFEMAELDYASVLLMARADWPMVQHLVLTNANLHSQGMEAMRHGNWPVLKTLELDHCNLNSNSIVHLTAGNWPQLESLWLGYNPLTASDIAQLATGNWPQLQHLDLSGVFNNVVTDKDGKVTAQQPASEQLCRAFMYHVSTGSWPQMERIKLSRCRLNFANIDSLMRCHWPRLAYLDLSQQQLGNDSFALLSESEWPMLQWLDLADTGIGPTAMSYLVVAKWPVLKTLDLSSNAPHLTVDVVTLLAQITVGSPREVVAAWKPVEHTRCCAVVAGKMYLAKAQISGCVLS